MPTSYEPADDVEPPSLRRDIEAWISDDPDPATVSELRGLLAQEHWGELTDLFSGRLQFGTAGLRAPLGAGPRRMNLAVVRTTSHAVAGWLDARREGGPVVVGHDARYGSERFAADAAATVAATGRRAFAAGGLAPTPLIAFAVPHLAAAAGIVVTASHNPATDNGYKVYDHTGSQIIPPADAEISAGVARAPGAAHIATDPAAVEPLPRSVRDAYVDMAAPLGTTTANRDLRFVYTPVHGVGLELFRSCVAAAGYPAPIVVTAQATPDPTFPTAPFPNPEEPGVLDLALEAAVAEDADLVLAHDPDADRLAVAVPDPHLGRWRRLTGDEIGVLLGWQRLRGTNGSDRLVASSIVSASWLDRIAASFGVPARRTLTGFKWISRAGDVDGRRLVFGYEEALGYAVTPQVRDKDGITAALVCLALAAELRAEGLGMVSLLDHLAREHGGSATAQLSVRDEAAGASERIASRMAALRDHPPRSIGDVPLVARRDLLADEVLPASDVLCWTLAGGRRVTLRPSGTEPKLKCYLEVPLRPEGDGVADAAAARDDATEDLARLYRSMELLLHG